MKNIIIIGSRGYEKNYGGWETFVTNLINNYNDEDVKFYVPELNHNLKNNGTEIRNGVICPQIYSPKLGFVTMFIFTIKAVLYFKKYIKKEKLDNVILYVLGSKVGPLFSIVENSFKKLNVKIVFNPDGLEWQREKWAWWIKQCFKISERTMVKHSNHIVCDSKNIESYIKEKYAKYEKNTSFIAYGAYQKEVKDINTATQDFYDKYNIKVHEYYLIVGRFVPENNYELIINEFMKSNTNKDLVIICNLRKNKFYKKLLKKTHFDKDKRIKFVGPVYDNEILDRVRKNASAYIHGHSAGGTNPSLLEALSLTDVNILFNACYNEEVGEDACLYFSKEEDSLVNVINKVDKFKSKEINEYSEKAKNRINNEYTWDIVVRKYKKLFEKLLKD